jgi:hypothetical protein
LHCFDGFSSRLSTLLQIKELSCFCRDCIDDNPTQCQHIEWTGCFKLYMVKGVLPADVRPDVEDMGVGQGGKAWAQSSLAELLQEGNFYAVQAKKPNEWNADFYISQCEQTLHIVKEDFEDAYKEKFKPGDKAVKGRFFEPRPSNCSMRYVFDDANPFG